MTDLEKLLQDKQDQLRGRKRDWIDDFKDWRHRVDWVTASIMAVLVLIMLLTVIGAASAAECRSTRDHDGDRWAYRIIDSKRCWYIGRPGKSKALLHWPKPIHRDVEPKRKIVAAEPPSKPPIEIADASVNVEVEKPQPELTPEALLMTARLPVVFDKPVVRPPPPPPAPKADQYEWALLLIIPVFMSVLLVFASTFQPEEKGPRGWIWTKRLRNRWRNLQAALNGRLDQMSNRKPLSYTHHESRRVRIDTTSPNSEKQSLHLWYNQPKSTSTERKSSSNKPTSLLTTFDPRSLRSLLNSNG